jgi:hypothetical protein
MGTKKECLLLLLLFNVALEVSANAITQEKRGTERKTHHLSLVDDTLEYIVSPKESINKLLEFIIWQGC